MPRSEYVNQDVHEPRPERPNTLPRKISKVDRRLPNGHSVENPRYLVPSTSPAFDNPYYLDLVAKARAVAGATAAAAADGGPAEPQRDVPRQINGFVTPTAENPEYLGLADTWSGYT